jgi:hypothetical protein
MRNKRRSYALMGLGTTGALVEAHRPLEAGGLRGRVVLDFSI